MDSLILVWYKKLAIVRIAQIKVYHVILVKTLYPFVWRSFYLYSVEADEMHLQKYPFRNFL